MAAKTISFPKGRGHLTHNNREFISKNVVSERTSWNRIYQMESLEAAYENCFGEALRKYNAAQKRKDRQKENYQKEIEQSGNGEKPFYENIVQIGKKTDTPVVDEKGELTEDAKAAIKVLEQYATTFQERNPNLYLFNCVLHLDEATPHLHIDYIPVAHGYKKGMETRNSLTKALQEMGFAKAVSRKQNETVAWQERERAFLTELCREQGIEIEILGIQRENLSLPEYKAAMREVEVLEQRAEILDSQKERLEQQKEDLEQKTTELHGQVQEMEMQNQELLIQAQELSKQIKELETKEKVNQGIFEKHDLRASVLKTISKEIEAEIKEKKSVAVPINSLFGKEEYVKVKKSDWDKMIEAFHQVVLRNFLLEKYEIKLIQMEKRTTGLMDQVEKLKQYVTLKGLKEEFKEYLKSLTQKPFKQKLEEVKVEAIKQNCQRKIGEQNLQRENTYWKKEM